jgi:hypothetical protein
VALQLCAIPEVVVGNFLDLHQPRCLPCSSSRKISELTPTCAHSSMCRISFCLLFAMCGCVCYGCTRSSASLTGNVCVSSLPRVIAWMAMLACRGCGEPCSWGRFGGCQLLSNPATAPPQVLLEVGRDYDAIQAATHSTRLDPRFAPGHLTLGRYVGVRVCA